MARKDLSLDRIARRYPIILIDTCALFEPLNGGNGDTYANMNEKILISDRRCNSAVLFREFVKRRVNLYITPMILEEYCNNANFLKLIENGDGSLNEGQIELNKIRTREKKQRKLLVDFLSKTEGNIIQLDKDEEKRYHHIYQRYLDLKINNGLGDADYDLLVSGLVTSETRAPTCLISNDFGILNSRISLLNKENIGSEQFGFFLRKKFSRFENVDLEY